MNMKNEVGGEERFRKEKAKGRKLRQSQWWKEKISKGVCHYCAGEFTPVSLYYTSAEIILRDKMGTDIEF
jgi:hypothetical protein